MEQQQLYAKYCKKCREDESDMDSAFQKQERPQTGYTNNYVTQIVSFSPKFLLLFLSTQLDILPNLLYSWVWPCA